ncbi:MAG: tRNA (adenosine(37)-N6)-threonylcarbamoyltransferase complex transferase subunit TsaD [Pseudomonadota bacterium]
MRDAVTCRETGAVRTRTVLGIESTCDETAAAVVRVSGAAPDGLSGEILSNRVWSQEGLHDLYGGVVPEIAARAHVERLDAVVLQALTEAGVGLDAIDAVAVASGPGLIGGVVAGVATAEAIAAARGLPLYGINHLEGHALTPRLTDRIAYPYLLLLASGGHCQLLSIRGLGAYRRLGGSIDDSPGEAFDKIAKHLGLGFPGGPDVERWAERGDPARFDLPRPLLNRPGADMSFSGLKTAARLAADTLTEAQGGLHDQDIADLCASFQAAVAETLAAKTDRAVALAAEDRPETLAVAGGVAANRALRAALERIAAAHGLAFVAPPLKLCTDNAAMIAWAAAERVAAGLPPDPADAVARPRWPLDPDGAPLIGGGKRGAKA